MEKLNYIEVMTNRYKSLQQRCVNGKYSGSSAVKSTRQIASYQRKGITLDFTLAEFLEFAEKNYNLFCELESQNKRPTVARKDQSKSYTLENIEIVPKIVSYERRYNKPCFELSPEEKIIKKMENKKIYEKTHPELDKQD